MYLKRITAIAGGLALALPLAACGDDDSVASGDSFCDQLESFADEYQGLDDTAIEEDPSMLTGMSDAIQTLADSAPDEIKDDWDTMASAFDTITSFATDSPDPEDTDALEEQMSIMQEMQSAGENVNVHAEEECGIEMDG